MPGHVDPITRGRLETAGLWRTWRKRRDELRNGGLPAEQAARQALRELLPTEGVPLPPMPPALAGKTASETAALRWVARNLDNPDVDPEACPDPFAWALLRQCRQDPAARLSFIEKLWGKLLAPPRGQPQPDTEGAPRDARPTPELLERLRAIGTGVR